MANPTNFAMASEGLKLSTGIASGAVARGQCVKRTVSANAFEACDTKGERVDGIAWTAAADTEAFSYVALTPGALLGEVIAGAALATLGTDLVTDATGKAIATDGASQFVIGRNRSTTSAGDEWVGVELEDGLRVTSA